MTTRKLIFVKAGAIVLFARPTWGRKRSIRRIFGKCPWLNVC